MSFTQTHLSVRVKKQFPIPIFWNCFSLTSKRDAKVRKKCSDFPFCLLPPLQSIFYMDQVEKFQKSTFEHSDISPNQMKFVRTFNFVFLQWPRNIQRLPSHSVFIQPLSLRFYYLRHPFGVITVWFSTPEINVCHSNTCFHESSLFSKWFLNEFLIEKYRTNCKKERMDMQSARSKLSVLLFTTDHKGIHHIWNWQSVTECHLVQLGFFL